jgi:hypothetical protein
MIQVILVKRLQLVHLGCIEFLLRYERYSNHEGVLIAISKEFISSEIKELQTDYEIVWAEINIAGTKKIIIGFYYRPPSDDGKSLDNLDESLKMMSGLVELIISSRSDFLLQTD